MIISWMLQKNIWLFFMPSIARSFISSLIFNVTMQMGESTSSGTSVLHQEIRGIANNLKDAFMSIEIASFIFIFGKYLSYLLGNL